jgi:hypothetical protein
MNKFILKKKNLRSAQQNFFFSLFCRFLFSVFPTTLDFFQQKKVWEVRLSVFFLSFSERKILVFFLLINVRSGKFNIFSECYICGKKWARKKHMLRHLKVHEPPTPKNQKVWISENFRLLVFFFNSFFSF